MAYLCDERRFALIRRVRSVHDFVGRIQVPPLAQVRLQELE